MNPEFRARTTLEASLSPSEDPGKVEEAMRNVLEGSAYTFERQRHRLRMSSDDPAVLGKLRNQLRDRRVRDAARRLMTRERSGDTVKVMLNRQAATAGILVLCSSDQESPLGPLFLTITSKDTDRVVEWLVGYESG